MKSISSNRASNVLVCLTMVLTCCLTIGLWENVNAVGVSGLGTTPELCTNNNKGRCDCSNESGFQTYTFMSGGEQRCFTIYLPSAVLSASAKGAILLHADCYAVDRLAELNLKQGSPMIRAANKYSFAVIGLSTPASDWQIGYNGIVNSTYPMQCSRDASIDIAYVEAIFKYVVDYSDDLNLDPSRFYASGFSQNSMFSAYVGYCFPDHVKGIWQGGSGLAITGQRPFTPRMEAQCSSSSFEQYEHNCLLQEPCTTCDFWPIFPCYQTTSPMVECLSSYDDDGIIHDLGPLSSNSTSMYMYTALVAEGHDARLFTFTPDPANGIKGGHSDAKNTYAWVNGCLGITPSCSSECEYSFASCVQSKTISGVTKAWMVFRDCEETIESLSGCAAGCAPTLEMLKLSEVPSTILLSHGKFGATNTSSVSRVQPTSSTCVSSRTGYQISEYGSSSPISPPLPPQLTPPQSPPSSPKDVFVKLDLVGETAATFTQVPQNQYVASVAAIADVPRFAVKILSSRDINVEFSTPQAGRRKLQSNSVLQVDTRILPPPSPILTSSGELLTSSYIFNAITNSVSNGTFVVELNNNGLTSVTMAGISSISLDGIASTTILNTSLVTATGASYPRVSLEQTNDPAQTSTPLSLSPVAAPTLATPVNAAPTLSTLITKGCDDNKALAIGLGVGGGALFIIAILAFLLINSRNKKSM